MKAGLCLADVKSVLDQKGVVMTFLPRVLFTAACAVAAAAWSSGSLVAHEPAKKPGMMGKMGSDAMLAAMKKGCAAPMKMTGDADHDFASMMAMHHQMAIDMAQVELKEGRDPKIQDMARRIIDAQKKEIAAFEAWMKDHKPAAGHAH